MKTMTVSVNVESVPKLTHREAATLAATEFDRVIELLTQLTPEEWAMPTACERWNVRAMVAHMLGMAEAQASFRQFAHDGRAASKRESGAWIDEVTATQVRERADLTTSELVERFVAVAPRAVRARKRTPALVRWAVRMKSDPPYDKERFSLGYIYDVLSTRDPWMHRNDISRATGRPMVLTPEHDGRLVELAVAEWAQRHGKPFTLTLTGPVGGQWHSGEGGEPIELDALDFCWKLSGRGSVDDLLDTPVPF